MSYIQRLNNLINALEEEILNLSDEELMEDLHSIGVSPEDHTKEIQRVLTTLIQQENRNESPMRENTQ